MVNAIRRNGVVLYARLSGIATLSRGEGGATATRSASPTGRSLKNCLARRVRVTGFDKSRASSVNSFISSVEKNESRAGFHTSAGTSPARSASPRRGGTRRSAGMELPRAPRAKRFGIDSQRDAAAPECFRPHRRVHVFAYRRGPNSVYDSREVEPGFEREQGCP